MAVRRESGAPLGNKNAVKHGQYARQAIEERRQLGELIRQSRELLEKIKFWGPNECKDSRHCPKVRRLELVSGGLYSWLLRLDLFNSGCLRRTPGAALPSSMISTPAVSNALRTAAAFANVIAVSPSTAVERLTPERQLCRMRFV